MKIPGMTAALLALTLALTPLHAKWSQLQPTKPVAVANGAMTVVPGPGWNASSAHPFKKSESWSYDGPLLNEIVFYGGVQDGEPLAREINKKYKPLPKFSRSMLASDVVQAFEETQRINLQTSDFAVDSTSPDVFAGRPGFKFTYHSTVPDEELTRKGEGRGAIIGGKLYMITYQAAALYYFDAGIDRARLIMDSTKIS